MKRTVINIVSGKGGTGKTLLTASLADLLGNRGKEVLCVDIDVFVRGLTALLYFHRQEALNIIDSDQLSVSDLFISAQSKSESTKFKDSKKALGICRYRTFSVLPAVSRIDENLALRELLPDTREEAKSILKNLIDRIPQEFEVILMDSRAGYDEIVAATHEVSDISICVEEEDSIARITTDNLVTQLQRESGTPLFRLVNKARGVHSVEESERRGVGVSDLGAIPFDIDVMNSFGSNTFWDDIVKSLYKSSLARAWNRLSTKMRLNCEVLAPRISPLGSERFEEKLGVLTWRDRVIFVYGILIAIGGLAYSFSENDYFYRFSKSPTHLSAFIIGVIGMMLSLYVVTRLGLAPRKRDSLRKPK